MPNGEPYKHSYRRHRRSSKPHSESAAHNASERPYQELRKLDRRHVTSRILKHCIAQTTHSEQNTQYCSESEVWHKPCALLSLPPNDGGATTCENRGLADCVAGAEVAAELVGLGVAETDTAVAAFATGLDGLALVWGFTFACTEACVACFFAIGAAGTGVGSSD